MAQAYFPQQPTAQAGPDSVQERIENGVNIEDVQQAYLQLQTRYVGFKPSCLCATADTNMRL